MKVVWLGIGLGLFALTALIFYFRQNAEGTLGGPISQTKTFWLFWALFYYFYLSIWIYIALPVSHLSILLLVFILTIGLRAIIQPLLLYVTKSWTPYYGISFNLFVGFGVSTYLVKCIASENEWSMIDWIYSTYLTGVVLALFTDSFYAIKFHRIIKEGTKGTSAIWYASNQDKRFQGINRVTFYLNMLFSVLLLMVLLQIFSL